MKDTRHFELLERIGNLVRAEERQAAGRFALQPVHLHVLRYLVRANRYSNTPAAVTEYFAATKGTVSQTLLVLERGGFLRKKIDSKDGRKVHLHLTPKGRRAVQSASPPPIVAKTVGELGESGLANLSAGLETYLAALQRANQSRSFGVCSTCRFFLREDDGFRCGLTLESLSDADSEKICREHQLPELAAD